MKINDLNLRLGHTKKIALFSLLQWKASNFDVS